MWKSKRQKAEGSMQKAASRSTPTLGLMLAAYCLLFSVGCRQDMQDQPRMKPFRATAFFQDGISSRPPVAGTVPRGYLKADKEFFTGKKSTARNESAVGSPSGTASSPAPMAAAMPTGTSGPNATQSAAYPDDVEIFPLPITLEVVKRGKERYEIFCSACHGMTGNGDGMIARRGFRRAASFHTDSLRQAPVGHYFDAITNGWGAMPSYAPQIPPQDRWAIVAYIRALQLSRPGKQPTAGQSAPSANQPAATSTGGHK